MNEIRVVIIDQSKQICSNLSDALNRHQHIKIIGYTNSREEGLQLIKTLRPSVAIIDILFLKESDWNTSLFQSISVLLLARPLVDEVAKTLRAISLGAVDFINKTDLEQHDLQIALISKINNAHKRKPAKVNLKHSKNYSTYNVVDHDENDLKNKVKQKPIDNMLNVKQSTIIAIGTSTGGPKALQTVLEKLPKNFSAPIFVVQHMPSGFTKSLAKRLHRSTELSVKEAVDNDIVQPGTVYIAPGNYHLTISQDRDVLRTHLNQDELYRGHRPSVDILFNSIAQLTGLNKIAVILTGMGKDGAEGIEAIKHENESSIIIAESDQSAVIFGMPQAAIKTNCVTHISHVDEIGTMLKNYIER